MTRKDQSFVLTLAFLSASLLSIYLGAYMAAGFFGTFCLACMWTTLE